jgi:energy-coupling factor transporter ATP-binding protein EcfA2
MGEALNDCKKFLESRYRSLLGLPAGFADSIRSDAPAWLSVSLNDLGKTSKEGHQAAALVDPEIGTLLYLLEYVSGQDIVPLIVRALSLRSRFLVRQENSEAKESDPLGSWRVAVYWLVSDRGLLQEWERDVARLRAEAPHTEEIPIDSICLGENGWARAFEKHGFPRLLLNTRQVLKISNRAEVERWSAADARVADELQGFSTLFRDRTQRELALGVERHLDVLKSQNASGRAQALGGKRDYQLPQRIGIQNFRNIQEASVEISPERVFCSVLTGPNGSGKSTLFEAISLATFGSSSRYLDYLRDGDAGRRAPSDYTARYLKNITFGDWGEPQLRTGDKWESIRLPQTEEEAAAIERDSNGCLLSQERSAMFCKRTSSELAVDVLRGYSDLADGIQWYVEDEYQKANSHRQELLRSLGLRANITKADTAYQKVAEQRLSAALPFSSSNLVAWLSVAAKEYGDFLPTAERAATLWERWERRRTEVAEQSVSLLEDVPVTQGILKWLSEFNSAAVESSKVTGNHVQALVDHLRLGKTSIVDQLGLWAQWLARYDQAKVSIDHGSVRDIVSARDALTKQQAEITKRGSLTKVRLDHLEATRSTIASKWAEEHAKTCPTCNSDLESLGGFSAVLAGLIESTARERGELELQFSELSKMLRDQNERLAQLGVASNPLEEEQQQTIVRLISPFLPLELTVDEMLRSHSTAERFTSFISHLQACPQVPERADEQRVSEATAKEIISLCASVSQTFNAPTNWAAVRKAMTEKLGDVVKSHLPNTIGALWIELVLNLTAAPWLLRLKPTFHARTQRQSQSLTIRIGVDEGAPLARHILNQAEINVLGLAWFFVRFILSGRFLLPLLVLDDPAQQMDQTTYRDLCRLLETIVRVHRKNKSPLSLIVLFHQEDRAMDAARALSATLNVLSWAEMQSSDSIRRVHVFGDSRSLAPSAVLAQ